MTARVVDFSLPNVAAGADPFSLDTLPDDVEFVLLFFQRDHYCPNCHNQVQELADRIDAFHERNVEVVSIVPEPIERVEKWQERYDLPFPLLADPDASVGDAYGQPVRFGILGDLSDFFGRMPAIVGIDRSGEQPAVVYTHSGRSTFDRPDIDAVLAELDRLQSS